MDEAKPGARRKGLRILQAVDSSRMATWRVSLGREANPEIPRAGPPASSAGGPVEIHYFRQNAPAVSFKDRYFKTVVFSPRLTEFFLYSFL